MHVTTDLQDKRLWSRNLTLSSPHWINGEPSETGDYTVRTRYRAPLLTLQTLQKQPNSQWKLELTDEVRALTPGQSTVIYQEDKVVGSGIVV